MKLFDMQRLTVFCAGAVGAVCSCAFAGISPPVLSMEINVFSKNDLNNPVFNQVFEPTLVGPVGDPNNLIWNYNVNVSDNNNGSFSATGGINASPTTSPIAALLNPNLTFTNTSGESLWFFVRVTMPVAHTFDLPLDWTSSAGYNFAGPTGTQLDSLDDYPMWTVGVDGNPLGSALTGDVTLTPTNSNINEGIGGSVPGAVSSYMYVDFAFKLSTDAIGGPSGTFFIVAPAPGALALLALGGLVGRPRRRTLA